MKGKEATEGTDCTDGMNMVDPVKASFDSLAGRYDEQRRQLIPCYDDFYGVTAGLAARGPPASRVLDLGAGTGLLTWHILERKPGAVCTLVDFSAEMLNVAKKRFEGRSNVSFITGDYRGCDLGDGYDVIVSSLSIHHLDDGDKERLYGRLYHLLKDGGTFINADQVLGPTAAIEADYRRRWNEKILASDLPEAEKAAVLERMRMDRPATLADNMRWLKCSGFKDVDIFYKYYNFAVMYGKKYPG